MHKSHIDESLTEAGRLIANAASIVALTGAGISAESGIPTFRGADGFWRRRKVADLATPQGFARDPATVWQWYSERRKQCLECRPNAGHRALAELERQRPDRTTIITQNVDGFHRRAGNANVIEIHGQLFLTRCSRCPYELHNDERSYNKPPKCPECGSYLRPGVVWFGELLPPDALEAAGRAAEECDVMLVVGTSAVVQPVASLPLYAKVHGACLIEVNPDETPITDACDFVFHTTGGEALPRLIKEAMSVVT